MSTQINIGDLPELYWVTPHSMLSLNLPSKPFEDLHAGDKAKFNSTKQTQT